MSAKKKTQPVLEDPAAAKPPSLEKELTDSSKHDWKKLQRLAPLNTGPRMLYVLVDSPPLRHRLAEQLEASLQQAGHAVARLDFTQPHYRPLQKIFDQAEQHPQARFFFLFGLERSLLSSEHRISALTDLNFHRDQISKRLPCPLIIWIPDGTFTDLLINAPDFMAWRGGVFNITDETSEREIPYRQHIIEQFGKLTLYSATADAPLAVDLEQVFVKLTATQRRRTMTVRSIGLWRDVEASLRQSVDETVEFPPRKKGINPSHPQAPQEAELAQLQESTITRSLAEALHDNQYLAVIGAPGSGKTTLLKYLALSFARRQAHERLELAEDRLPILVYLRDFGPFLDTAAQQEDGVSLLFHFLSEQYRKTATYLNLPNEFFSRQLEAGHCIVLLDGLDEVLDSQKRSRVIDMIAALASRYPGNRFIVTSRPRGYEGEAQQHLSSRYAECTIRDFDDADMQAFARSWYTAVTIDRQGDTATARTTAVTQADDLLRAIRADERVKALAHNPLLLSVLAMVHQRGVGLPQRRAELYDECTDMLLGYWDQSKGGEAARELANLGTINRTEKRTLLEPIALWFHERGEHGLEATKEELEAKIADQFTEIFGGTPEQARSRADLFLRMIDERAGLLVERATGVYAFAHLTFQEYLAARAIADHEDYIAYTLKRLHKPWWREVILLEVGHLSDQRYIGRRTRKLTSDLIRAIRDAGSWLEDVLKRDLLFAARCLCDTGPLSIDNELRQSLINALILLWRTTPYDLQPQEVVDVFTLMMTTANGKRIQAELLLSLNGQEESERARALSATENIGASINILEITNSLLSLIRTAKSAEDQAKAARALKRVGSPEIVHEEIQGQLTLTMSGVMEERLSALEILSAFAEAAETEAVIKRLLDLTGDQNREVRASAIHQLGIRGEEVLTSTVVEHLLKLLYDYEVRIPVVSP